MKMIRRVLKLGYSNVVVIPQNKSRELGIVPGDHVFIKVEKVKME